LATILVLNLFRLPTSFWIQTEVAVSEKLKLKENLNNKLLMHIMTTFCIKMEGDKLFKINDSETRIFTLSTIITSMIMVENDIVGRSRG